MTNENISVTEVQNENSVIAERRAKLLKLREHGVAIRMTLSARICSVTLTKSTATRPLKSLQRSRRRSLVQAV